MANILKELKSNVNIKYDKESWNQPPKAIAEFLPVILGAKLLSKRVDRV